MWGGRCVISFFLPSYFHRSNPALRWKEEESRAGAGAVGFSSVLEVRGVGFFSLFPVGKEPHSFEIFQSLIRDKRDNNSAGCVAIAGGTSANHGLHNHNSYYILFLLHWSNTHS